MIQLESQEQQIIRPDHSQQREMPRTEYSFVYHPLPAAEISLGTLRNWKYRVLKPIPITVSEELGSVVIHAEVLQQFGSGPSFGEALVDLQQGIVEVYETLLDDDDKLGTEMVRLLEMLRCYISLNENARVQQDNS
jgi:hypothetical protein